MVLHSLVLVLFTSEAALCLLLCAPLPQSVVKLMVDWHKSPHTSTTRTLSRVALFLIVCLCGEALFDMFFGAADIVHGNERYFRAQRNVYLTGSTLLLFILMRQLFALTAEAMKAKLDKDTMAKQARNQAEQADMVAKILKEEDAGAGTKAPSAAEQAKVTPPASAAAPAASVKAAEAALSDKQVAEYARTFEENASLKDGIKKAQANIRALREENSTLEGKCRDYEAFFGDEMKKKD